MKNKRKIIKINNNNHLSLGNFCRIIKELSPNKTLANQSNIFCTLLEEDDINDSTINNYCIGYRSIGNKYKQKMINLKEKYLNNNKVLLPIISNLYQIINGKYLQDEITIESINNDNNLLLLCTSLYNISKNDITVNKELKETLYKKLELKDLYNFIAITIFYIILEKKQPIYVENIVKNTIEDIINHTDISLNDFTSFLELQMKEGINYIYSLKQLEKNNNPYAAFELGRLEYLGNITGTPRYQKSYEYLTKAADKKHPRANYFIAKMLLNGNIGTKSNQDIDLALKHAKISEKLENIAASNLIGIIYLKYKNNKNLAISYFKKASINNYPYAYNNLGKIKEQEGKEKEAIEYYLKSANLEESWACNKVAEYYKQINELEKAYKYYNLALESNNSSLTNWPKYNLAINFYLNGSYKINIEKDSNKAIQLLKESANDNNIKAISYLIEHYAKEYYKNRKKDSLDNVYYYIHKLEKHPNYNIEYKEKIEKAINSIKNKKEINIEL